MTCQEDNKDYSILLNFTYNFESPKNDNNLVKPS